MKKYHKLLIPIFCSLSLSSCAVAASNYSSGLSLGMLITLMVILGKTISVIRSYKK